MELTKQDVLPHVVEILLGILVTSARATNRILDTGKSGKVFDVVQQDLSMSVVPLVVRLSSVGAPMELKVQLTVPGHELGTLFDLLLEGGKEVIDRTTDLDARQKPSLVTDATASSELLQMLPGRASTTIAFSKWQ